jgi:HEAT repeat protein
MLHSIRTARSLLLVPVLLLALGCDSVTPADAVRLMEDRRSADARREGIADLSSRFAFARVPPYTSRYQQIARSDPDYTVRAMAIRALNISRDASATPIFIAALDDDAEPVRLEGAKALANVPDPAAVPGLLRLVRGVRETVVDGHPSTAQEDRDVRIAAADALRHYPTLDVERSLIGYLNETEFAVAWQARQSLVALTGQDMLYDEAAWLAYLVRAGM